MLRSLFTVGEHLWYRTRGEIHSRIKSERGAVSAEYAILVVFIALVIIIGATALGIAINVSAAREGAPVAAVRGTPEEVMSRSNEAGVGYPIGPGTPTLNHTCDE